MAANSGPDITGLIHAWGEGDAQALNQLMEATYPELRRIAMRYFRGERASHTLQCTALIHEAYVRLAEGPEKHWKDRAHFFGFSARLMRSILVDYARARLAKKRGGGAPVTVVEANTPSPTMAVDVLDLNAAMDELAKLDPFQAQVVELRYFGGLSVRETAEVTRVSESTVKREWILAKTWIRRRILEEGSRP